MQAKLCSQVCPHLSVFQLANVFGPIDNSINVNTPETILIGMNIPDRLDSLVSDPILNVLIVYMYNSILFLFFFVVPMDLTVCQLQSDPSVQQVKVKLVQEDAAA